MEYKNVGGQLETSEVIATKYEISELRERKQMIKHEISQMQTELAKVQLLIDEAKKINII